MKYLKKYILLRIIILLTLFYTSCLERSQSRAPEINNYSTRKGTYTHSSFQSKSRGGVDFNVYLPPNWTVDNPVKYPLIILLHGQGESENSFPNAISADSLNFWINQNILPELILISLRGGEDTREILKMIKSELLDQKQI